ncbi:hypothetical protein OAI_00095 [Vibrio cyclitrophicus FF160]|uniref:hypothetical protein n=1 Tax=Vibrio cyclitrophicus TaxID=47951 RepID=UPI0003065939|nr:hypothetical protein [Vibrio cyclitrophicus]OEE85876.1 hypothetical protein OAI_00095 [Vibrio cyclitrophicus FF160]PMJ19149.1 hypothetical protein BCU28_15775 [Vibrio cyclitrophicus]
MKTSNKEKLEITDNDSLRRRHAGNYKPIDNGERYLLPYEVHLRTQPPEFFKQLSDYDFLKSPVPGAALTFSGLLDELECLDDLESERGFWKNFNESALNRYLNPILGTAKDSQGWKKTYLKIKKETDTDKPHHNDMLRCVYLLAHLHKASPSYIRQLAGENDVWSTDLRVYYPRKDFAFSEEYTGYLSELYANMLFHQPDKIRRLIKCLDVCIEKLTQHANSDWIAPFLMHRTNDTSPPSLKILKYNQIASITHFSALNKYLQDKVTGPFSPISFAKLEANEKDPSGLQIAATAQQYKLVAALCMRIPLPNPLREVNGGWVSEGTDPITCKDMKLCIDAVANALAADALNQLKIESYGTKSGKRDTSIPAAIKKLAEQNPQTIEEILRIGSPDFASMPELYSFYLRKRSEYAVAKVRRPGGLKKSVLSNMPPTPRAVIESMQPNPNLKRVLDYIRGNNLDKISFDIEGLERDLMMGRLREGADPKVGIIYQFVPQSLPLRV